MESTASFLALETMLRQGWLMTSFADFEHSLDLLEQKGQISAAEHQALLALAAKLGLDQAPHAEEDSKE